MTDTGLGVAGAALMGLTGTVLLIACLNLANMLLARGTIRRKEIALRLALGGSRSRIVRQLLTESLLLAVVGAAAGLVFAYWATTYLVASLVRVLPLTLVFEPRPDMNVLLATAGFVGFATLLAGIGPALKMSRVDLVTDLKEQASDTGARPGRFTARNMLVVGQLALSLGLLCAGGLFARSMIKATSANPGFSYDGGLLATLDVGVAQINEARGRDLYRAVLERVRTMPGIEAAALASTVPFGAFHEGRLVERPGCAARSGAVRPDLPHRVRPVTSGRSVSRCVERTGLHDRRGTVRQRRPGRDHRRGPGPSAVPERRPGRPDDPLHPARG